MTSKRNLNVNVDADLNVKSDLLHILTNTSTELKVKVWVSSIPTFNLIA